MPRANRYFLLEKKFGVVTNEYHSHLRRRKSSLRLVAEFAYPMPAQSAWRIGYYPSAGQTGRRFGYREAD